MIYSIYIYISCPLNFILFGIYAQHFTIFWYFKILFLIYIWDKHYFSHFKNNLPFISFQIILLFFPIHFLNKWMEHIVECICDLYT
jgi:hypothetical protein